MNVKEALEYKPLLKVKEGENLKTKCIAEYDKMKVYIIAIVLKNILHFFSMKEVETFI